mgnify:CR=1 FL=1
MYPLNERSLKIVKYSYHFKTDKKIFKMLPAALMPDGSEITIPLAVIRGVEDGPVLSVVGGVHRNEYEGPLAIRKLIKELEPTGGNYPSLYLFYAK